MSISTWADKLLHAYRIVLAAGSAVAPRSSLNFVGCTVTDDETNDRTTVDVSPTGLTLDGNVQGPLAETRVFRVSGDDSGELITDSAFEYFPGSTQGGVIGEGNQSTFLARVGVSGATPPALATLYTSATMTALTSMRKVWLSVYATDGTDCAGWDLEFLQLYTGPETSTMVGGNIVSAAPALTSGATPNTAGASAWRVSVTKSGTTFVVETLGAALFYVAIRIENAGA